MTSYFHLLWKKNKECFLLKRANCSENTPHGLFLLLFVDTVKR